MDEVLQLNTNIFSGNLLTFINLKLKSCITDFYIKIQSVFTIKLGYFKIRLCEENVITYSTLHTIAASHRLLFQKSCR